MYDPLAAACKRQAPFVIVIDDSLTVRKMLEVSLTRAGFAARSFPDGREALGALASGAVPVPDLIVLDIGLPKLNGYAVARLIKRTPRLRHIVIILLSGRDGVVDHLRGRLAGASAYLTKPFRPAELIALLRRHLASVAGDAESSGEDVREFRYG